MIFRQMGERKVEEQQGNVVAIFDFRGVCDSIVSYISCNNFNAFRIPMQQIRLIKMCV
jgi:hypothetical protein